MAKAMVLAAVLAVSLFCTTAAQAGNVDRMSYAQLERAANNAIRHGHVYSHRWGDASPWLKTLCYEMVERAFAPYGTQRWAVYIVNRESGCNPAAINTTYSDPCQRATGLSQMIPCVHRWVNYSRVQRDMGYAVAVFVKLSNGGRSTGPWS